MRRPLVPIDGSDSAMRALAHALVELRGQTDAELHLINVQTPVVHTFPSKLVSPDLIEQEQRREGESVLEPARALVESAGVKCVSLVRIGHPGHDIAVCAADQGCDAIVMGTRGMGAVAGLMLGSVANKVVHLTQLPVTLLK